MRPALRLLAMGVVVPLAACSASQASPVPALRLSPAQAVINAAEMPQGVSGVFEMVVRATGRDNGLLYLNSEADYRDPRTLTIVVAPAIERQLSARLGKPVEQAIKGKAVAVRGTARKTRIDFTSDGRPTGKYYFQTHLTLMSARNLTVAGEPPME